MADLYQILSITNQATELEIKKAYIRLINQWHPDKAPTSTDIPQYQQKFQEITHAYQILSNPSKRLIYDNLSWHSKNLSYDEIPEDLLNRYYDPDTKQFNLKHFNEDYITGIHLSEDIRNLLTNYRETPLTAEEFVNKTEILRLERVDDPEIKIEPPQGIFTLSKFNQVFEQNQQENKQKKQEIIFNAVSSVRRKHLANDPNPISCKLNPKNVNWNSYIDKPMIKQASVTDEELTDFINHRNAELRRIMTMYPNPNA